MAMHALITGGSGLIGTRLIPMLLEKGWQVHNLSRKMTPSNQDGLTNYRWDGLRIPDAVPAADVVFNLAGANIAGGRWTDAFKKEILNSRLNATRACVNWINAKGLKDTILLNASAVGYYGTQRSTPLTEADSAGKDFLANVCQTVENEAKKANCRLLLPRIGVVLAEEGGAFPKLIAPFKAYAGGWLGSGTQGFPWVHIQDLLSAFFFLIETPGTEGIYNLAGPQQATNKDFGIEAGKQLGKPARLPVPALAVKTLMGESAMLVLEGQFVVPRRLQEAGFEFAYPTISTCIADLLTRYK